MQTKNEKEMRVKEARIVELDEYINDLKSDRDAIESEIREYRVERKRLVEEVGWGSP